MAKQITIRGQKQLLDKLKSNASMVDVKNVVKKNTAELTASMQRKSQEVLTGHYEGNKFVKPTGTTKRSITMKISNNGLTGHTGPKTEYAPYLIHGTRFMAKRDFFFPPINIQKVTFRNDLERLMK